eukprot:1391679-Amorphochlora_amoeboformis.AAC.2
MLRLWELGLTLEWDNIVGGSSESGRGFRKRVLSQKRKSFVGFGRTERLEFRKNSIRTSPSTVAIPECTYNLMFVHTKCTTDIYNKSH